MSGGAGTQRSQPPGGMGLPARCCVLHQGKFCQPEATPDCHSDTEMCRGTNDSARAAGMVSTSTPLAWGATPALLTDPCFCPDPHCWLPLHSPAKREGLGVSHSEHQWWEGDTMLVPRCGLTPPLLLPVWGLTWLSWVGER